MMGKYYQTRTNRSKRKLHNLDGNAVTVEVADGKACFQIVLPFSEALFDMAKSIEQTASEAGLLLMKSFIDEEVRQLAGSRYHHDSNRQAVRWAGSVLLESEKRFYRMKGHRELPMLAEALNRNVDSKEAVA